MARCGRSVRSENIAVVHRQHGVFEQGEHGHELEELEHDPQVAPTPLSALAFGHVINIDPVNQHITGGGMVDASDHVEQGGFSATRFTHNSHELAGRNVYIHTTQGEIFTC